MGKYTQWIQHQGKRILVMDCSKVGSNESEYLNALDEAKDWLVAHAK